MRMKNIIRIIGIAALMVCAAFGAKAAGHEKGEPVKRVLFIGDSMTGWLSERLNAYGRENGFEVSTVVWDGSTIQKWANSPKLKSTIESVNPDAVFISLGLNELFEANPQANLNASVDKILHAVGDRDLVWVGPPSWPGHSKGEVLNKWLEKKLGSHRFFRSFDLKLKRQSSTNPHPSKEGIVEWVNALTEWLPAHSEVKFESLKAPASHQMVRGKHFIYKRMKETL